MDIVYILSICRLQNIDVSYDVIGQIIPIWND